TLDAGQQITLMASNIGGGTAPYTVNYIISNSITNSPLLAYQFNSVPAGENSFIWAVPPLILGNSIEANFVITDSSTTPLSANSTYIKSLTINPTPQLSA